MAEPRRIDLMTLETGSKADKKDKPRPTLRFNLALTESNDKTCPEFSYVELLKNALGDKKEKEDLDPNDPFAAKDEEEHDKMVALAKSFEQKYGMKKGAGRIRDLVDLGEGYDETDAFIDNSEAYDEIVPATLTTKLGGFYINSGVLDFREVSDDSSQEFQGKAKKKRRKMRIDSDDESQDGRKKKIKKRKFKDGEDGEMKRKKKKKLSASSIEDANGVKKVFKKRGRPPKIKPTSPTVSELLKQQSISTSGGQVQGTDVSSVVNGNLLNGESRGGSACVNTKETLANIEACINAVASGTDEDGAKLPSELPSDLLEPIEKIKKAAKMSEEGKSKFFTNFVNSLLLDIEIKARKLSSGVRSSVFAHLGTVLPCNKETLIKRAKKLRLNQQDSKLKEPIEKLQQAISRVMPSLLEKYTLECQNVVQKRQDRLLEEKREKVDSQDGPKEDRGSSDSEDDDKATNNEDTGKKRIMNPRKKFEWNDEIRSLLCDVVRIKMNVFDLVKIRDQSAEDYLKAFLDAEIKTLWPKGWIQTRMLFKESRSVHHRWTNPVLKPKKTVIVTKPVTPQVINVSPANLNSSNHSSQDEIQKTERLEMSPPVSSRPMPPPVTVTNSAGVMSLLDYAEARSSAVTTTTATQGLSHMLSPQQGASTAVPSNKIGGNSSKLISASAAEDLRHIIQATLKSSPEAVRSSLQTSVTMSKPNIQSPSAMSKATVSEANTFLMQFQKFAGSLYPQHSPTSQSPPQLPQSKSSSNKPSSNSTSPVYNNKGNVTRTNNDKNIRQSPSNSSSAQLKLPSPRTVNPAAGGVQTSTSLIANSTKFASSSSSIVTGKTQAAQAFTSALDMSKNQELSSGTVAGLQRSPAGHSSQAHRSSTNSSSQDVVMSNKSLYEALSSPDQRKSPATNPPRQQHQVPKTAVSTMNTQQQNTFHGQNKSSESLSTVTPKRHPAVMQALGSAASQNRGNSTQGSLSQNSPVNLEVQKNASLKPHSSVKQMSPTFSQSVGNVRQLQEKISSNSSKAGRSTASPTLNILGGITMSQLKKDAEMLAQQTKTSQSAFQHSTKAVQKPTPMLNSGLQLPRPTPVTPTSISQPSTWTTEQLAKFLSSPTQYMPSITSGNSTTATTSLSRSSPGYQGLHLVDRSADMSAMQVRKSSSDAIITGPAPGTFIHGHQRQSPGSAQSPMSASPRHVHSPQNPNQSSHRY